MGAVASQITSLTIIYSTLYSDADRRKHQSSVSLAFVREIHQSPVNSLHKWPVTRKVFPFDDVIMRPVSDWDSPIYINICMDVKQRAPPDRDWHFSVISVCPTQWRKHCQTSVYSLNMISSLNMICTKPNCSNIRWILCVLRSNTINTLRTRQMNAISQTTFSNGFSWMKMFEFRLKFHWSLFPRV